MIFYVGLSVRVMSHRIIKKSINYSQFKDSNAISNAASFEFVKWIMRLVINHCLLLDVVWLTNELKALKWLTWLIFHEQVMFLRSLSLKKKIKVHSTNWRISILSGNRVSNMNLTDQLIINKKQLMIFNGTQNIPVGLYNWIINC